MQNAVLGATGASDRGVVQRSDLTGFNWANVPAILVETGFITNPVESRRLHSGAYQQRVATGLSAGRSRVPGPLGGVVAAHLLGGGARPLVHGLAAVLDRSRLGSAAASTGVSAEAASSCCSSATVRDSSSFWRSSSARGSASGAAAGCGRSFR